MPFFSVTSSQQPVVDYAKKYKLIKLMNVLAQSVTDNQPVDPFMHMANYLESFTKERARIEDGCGLLGKVHVAYHGSSSVGSNLLESSHSAIGSLKGSDFLGSYGVWSQLRVSDVPRLAELLRRALKKQKIVQPPPEIISDLGTVLCILAHAMDVNNRRGFMEAAKLVTFKPSPFWPQSLYVLVRVIVDNVPLITRSEERGLLRFVMRLCRRLVHGAAVSSGASDPSRTMNCGISSGSVVCEYVQWESLHLHESLWKRFCDTARSTLLIVNPSLALDQNTFRFYVTFLDTLVASRCSGESLSTSFVKRVYASYSENVCMGMSPVSTSPAKMVVVVPDEFVLFMALFITSLETLVQDERAGVHLTDEMTIADMQSICVRMIPHVNDHATQTQSHVESEMTVNDVLLGHGWRSSPWIRRTDEALFRAFRAIFRGLQNEQQGTCPKPQPQHTFFHARHDNTSSSTSSGSVLSDRSTHPYGNNNTNDMMTKTTVADGSVDADGGGGSCDADDDSSLLIDVFQVYPGYSDEACESFVRILYDILTPMCGLGGYHGTLFGDISTSEWIKPSADQTPDGCCSGDGAIGGHSADNAPDSGSSNSSITSSMEETCEMTRHHREVHVRAVLGMLSALVQQRHVVSLATTRYCSLRCLFLGVTLTDVYEHVQQQLALRGKVSRVECGDGLPEPSDGAHALAVLEMMCEILLYVLTPEAIARVVESTRFLQSYTAYVQMVPRYMSTTLAAHVTARTSTACAGGPMCALARALPLLADFVDVFSWLKDVLDHFPCDAADRLGAQHMAQAQSRLRARVLLCRADTLPWCNALPMAMLAASVPLLQQSNEMLARLMPVLNVIAGLDAILSLCRCCMLYELPPPSPQPSLQNEQQPQQLHKQHEHALLTHDESGSTVLGRFALTEDVACVGRQCNLRAWSSSRRWQEMRLGESVAHASRSCLFAYLSRYHEQRAAHIFLRALENYVKRCPHQRSRVWRRGLRYEVVELTCWHLLLALLQCSVDAVVCMLHRPAHLLASYGVTAEDYVLFGLSLARQLRDPDFPELPWAIFYCQVIVPVLMAALPNWKSLAHYKSPACLSRIVRIQAWVRRVLRHRLAVSTQRDLDTFEQYL